MNPRVHMERDADVAVIVIDNPTINAGSAEVRRALLAMVNEAALLLAAGVADRASDIDVALVQGYGLPRWEGGPVFWARRQDRKALEQDMDGLAEVSGTGFVRGELRQLL